MHCAALVDNWLSETFHATAINCNLDNDSNHVFTDKRVTNIPECHNLITVLVFTPVAYLVESSRKFQKLCHLAVMPRALISWQGNCKAES